MLEEREKWGKGKVSCRLDSWRFQVREFMDALPMALAKDTGAGKQTNLAP